MSDEIPGQWVHNVRGIVVQQGKPSVDESYAEEIVAAIEQGGVTLRTREEAGLRTKVKRYTDPRAAVERWAVDVRFRGHVLYDFDTEYGADNYVRDLFRRAGVKEVKVWPVTSTTDVAKVLRGMTAEDRKAVRAVIKSLETYEHLKPFQGEASRKFVDQGGWLVQYIVMNNPDMIIVWNVERSQG
ncbi:hypothetical protein PV336_16295 [Streptomyces sp. MI02-2A]|uniref:hypothetical protein n=1 Tax=Streptomyces sp. MI02-2A TaxID=3028688 RepID=UPI0029AF7863|nr:hypothetical protein [Streptomyces sp. MI02-2A]MDX3260782.1 hypothetical protein [Streptomyces sp. MI02-2A]